MKSDLLPLDSQQGQAITAPALEGGCFQRAQSMAYFLFLRVLLIAFELIPPKLWMLLGQISFTSQSWDETPAFFSSVPFILWLESSSRKLDATFTMLHSFALLSIGSECLVLFTLASTNHKKFPREQQPDDYAEVPGGIKSIVLGFLGNETDRHKCIHTIYVHIQQCTWRSKRWTSFPLKIHVCVVLCVVYVLVVWLGTHVSVGTCMCVYVCMCTLGCRGQRLICGIFPQWVSPLFETWTLIKPKSHQCSYVGWPQNIRDPPDSFSPALGSAR